MTQRERTLSLVLILFIFVIGGGFAAYTLILTPIQEATREIGEIEIEVDKMEARETEVLTALKKYELQKKMSLPVEVDLARREYGMQLESLLRRSDFQPNAIKVTSREPDIKTAPQVAPKKSAYTKLQFDIQVTGDLTSLIEFLELFYKQPLLHQIKTFTVQRGTRINDRRKSGYDMDMTIIVEAIVLDKAESRPTLTHVPKEFNLVGGGGGAYAVGMIGLNTGRGSPYNFAPVLATPKREYASITGKNIFFGPPPPTPKTIVMEEERVREPDISPFIKLVGITNVDDKRAATFFDVYNKNDHRITENSDGTMKIESYYYLGDAKKPILPRPKFFEFGDQEGGNFRQFRVVKITDSEFFFQELDEVKNKKMQFGASLLGGGTIPQLFVEKTYVLRVGQNMKEGQLLTSREARQVFLGSVPPEPKEKPGL